jgi:hypothetical protein
MQGKARKEHGRAARRLALRQLGAQTQALDYAFAEQAPPVPHASGGGLQGNSLLHSAVQQTVRKAAPPLTVFVRQRIYSPIQKEDGMKSNMRRFVAI